MTEINYDLEDRTERFAEECRDYFKALPKTQSNIQYSGQGIRSSGSTASNYIEANEALSKKDFYMRIKICRKEVKETRLWLRLSEPTEVQEKEKQRLIKEATELLLIFSKILKSASQVIL